MMLRKAGFVTSNGMLDRKAAIEYLDASERTLERWINTNKPCKRALKLLEQKIAVRGCSFLELWRYGDFRPRVLETPVNTDLCQSQAENS